MGSQADNNHPTIVSMNQDINDGHSKFEKVRQPVAKAEQLVKVKNACSSGEAKVKESEEAVKKAKKAAPKGDLSLEKADAIDEACPTAMTLIRAVGNIVQPSVDRAPPKAKAELQRLLERKTATQTACTEVVTSTKERREAARSGSEDEGDG